MSEENNVTGTCLCGAVALNVPKIKTNVGACHCGMCRKWGAGPYFGVSAGSQLNIKGSDSLGLYESSKWASRGFCKKCGTSLFYLLKRPQSYIVNVELFDLPHLKFDHEVFIDSKPRYYEFSGERKCMTEKEVFEFFQSAT